MGLKGSESHALIRRYSTMQMLIPRLSFCFFLNLSSLCPIAHLCGWIFHYCFFGFPKQHFIKLKIEYANVNPESLIICSLYTATVALSYIAPLTSIHVTMPPLQTLHSNVLIINTLFMRFLFFIISLYIELLLQVTYKLQQKMPRVVSLSLSIMVFLINVHMCSHIQGLEHGLPTFIETKHS